MNPRSSLDELILAANLSTPEGLTRNLVETVAGYLIADTPDAPIRWESSTGRPFVLSRAVESTAEKLARLRQIISCLLAPGAMDAGWLGSCPPAAAVRRNPFIGIHLPGEGEALVDEFDYDEYDDDEGDDD